MAHTLLLADDSLTIRRVIELTFVGQDITVVAVSDGEQAVARLLAERFDIVLASIGLPGRNGYELAKFMRALPALRAVPVILLSGAFDIVDQARVRESGVSDVLIKPFEPGLVINRVKELLGISPKAAGQPAPSASGRLVTTNEAPPHAHGARPPMHDPPILGPNHEQLPSAQRAEPPAEPQQDFPAERQEQRETRPLEAAATPWGELDGDSGLRPEGSAAEGVAPGGDYVGQLDAAFDTLDARLAGRAAPARHASLMPRLADSGSRPAAFIGDEQMAPKSSRPSPVLEGDAEWFKARREIDAAFAAHSLRANEGVEGAEGTASAEGAAGAGRALGAEGAARAGSAASAASAARALGAEGAGSVAGVEGAEGLPGRNAAPVSGRAEAGPLELSDEAIDRIATRVADLLTHGSMGETVTRVVNEVSERLVVEEIARIRAAAQPKSS